MRHIKLFEDYTEEDLDDLMKDLYGIGISNVEVDIDHIDYPEKAAEEERQAEFWKPKFTRGVGLKSVSGEIKENEVDLEFSFSNGDNAGLYVVIHTPNVYSRNTSDFIINGKRYDAYDKYMELLENGSVIKAALDLYDGIKSQGEAFLK